MSTAVSNTISSLRTLRGLSRRELARRAECSDTTVRKVESGDQDPSLGLLRRLLDALDADTKTRADLVAPTE